MGMNDRLRAPPDFDGPVKDRKCTDVIFMILIICMWVAMTVVGITSISEGDVDKLLAPMAHNGTLCGVDSGFEDMPNLYYVNTEGSGVCIDSCPSETNTSTLICRYDVDESLSYAEKITDGYCLPTLESSEVVNYCVFSNSSIWDNVEESDLSNYISQFISDIITARGYVFGFGFGVATLVAFVYIGILQIPFLVGFVVWSCVLLVLIGLLALGFGAWSTAEDWNEEGTKSDTIVSGTYVCAVIAWILAFLWVCLFCFLAKRISLAIGVIKQAGRAIAGMLLLVVWPLVELAGCCVFLAVWMVYAAYTASLGEVTTKEVSSGGFDVSYKVYTYDQAVENRAWFLLFCLFWTLNFITAVGQIVIAMSVSKWYFAQNKFTVGSPTVVASAIKTFFFHLGTAAFGGLIVAIVEFIQAVLSYIRKKAKRSHNKIAEWIACCCVCCFWCLENCLRFINKNAYVQTALFSTPFCTSAANAFYLIARNLARVAAVTVLGDFILTVMTAFITIVTATLAYYAMDANIRDDLYSIVGPTIMTAVLAYFTGKMITTVYSMAITTILQCFVADEEMYPPSQQHAQRDLHEWVNRNGAPPEAADGPGRKGSMAQEHAWS